MKHNGRSERIDSVLAVVANLIARSQMTRFPHMGSRVFGAKVVESTVPGDDGFFMIEFPSHGLSFGYDVGSGGRMYTAYIHPPGSEGQKPTQIYYGHRDAWWVDGPVWAYTLNTFIPWFNETLRVNGHRIQSARTPQQEAEDEKLQGDMTAWFRARGATPPTASDGPFPQSTPGTDLGDDWNTLRGKK